MKIVTLIARILLGLVFLVFGLDKFYPFIPQGPMPAGVAGQFMGALFSTHYIMFVGVFETVGGLLMLINRYVPLALCLLAPVIVNILLVGLLMTHGVWRRASWWRFSGSWSFCGCGRHSTKSSR